MTSRCAKLVAHYTCKAGAAVICCAVFMKTTAIQRKNWPMLHDLRGGKPIFIQLLHTDTEIWMNETACGLVPEDISILWKCRDRKVKCRGREKLEVKRAAGQGWLIWLASGAAHRSPHLNQFHLSWDISQQILSIVCPCSAMLVIDSILTRLYLNGCWCQRSWIMLTHGLRDHVHRPERRRGSPARWALGLESGSLFLTFSADTPTQPYKWKQAWHWPVARGANTYWHETGAP